MNFASFPFSLYVTLEAMSLHFALYFAKRQAENFIFLLVLYFCLILLFSLYSPSHFGVSTLDLGTRSAYCASLHFIPSVILPPVQACKAGSDRAYVRKATCSVDGCGMLRSQSRP